MWMHKFSANAEIFLKNTTKYIHVREIYRWTFWHPSFDPLELTYSPVNSTWMEHLVTRLNHCEIHSATKDHLSLEALLSVLHDVKVFQVKVDVVPALTMLCGHVPYHHKGSSLYKRSCSRQGGVWVGKSMAEGLWHWSVGDGQEEEKEAKQQHDCSPTDVTFLC